MGCFSSQVVETERQVTPRRRDPTKEYSPNLVVNSKYTILSFFPKIFWTHIKRFMNLYFFIVAILQSIKDLSPVDPLTTWIPIAVIFLIAFLREGYDDIKQHREDSKINKREYIGISEGSVEKKMKSMDFHVGDVIKLMRDEECPVDLVLLKSGEENGSCSIETANLDGETNLKERVALGVTQEQDIHTIECEMTCQPPNKEIYNFQGSLRIQGKVYSLSEVNFIQSGTKLKNTEYIYGVTVYAGPQTKLGLNQQKPIVKWTKLEQFMNVISIGVFIVQWILALAAGTFANVYQVNNYKSMPYLGIDKYEAKDWVIMYVRFFLLTTSMIPISLKVTIDVCKFVYGMWIEMDNHMVANDRVNGIEEKHHARCTNTSVIEDLGAIEYIFSDKTGTLTENVMELKKFSANGKVYGHSQDCETIYEDAILTSAIQQKNQDVLALVRILALCHTLKIEYGEPIGMSPEEIAFIKGLKKLGFNITQEGKLISIQSDQFHIDKTSYMIDTILPFSFERKRMSVIALDTTTGQHILLSKGSGEYIKDLCKERFENFDEQLYRFASMGLRVMAESQKILTEEEYNSFITRLNSLKENVNRTKNDEEELYKQIENGSTLIGLTAIEDRLQQGVQETISMLRDAGIKIWMVTGDILPTALKISFSTQLIQNDGKIIDLSRNDTSISIETMLKSAIEYVNRETRHNPNFRYYLTLLGTSKNASLDDFLSPMYREDFQFLAAGAKCVIVSQATPSQKAAIVQCIREIGKTVLAVGDGGNDIPMIRGAQIGVGIIGKEGSQAASAADFAIHQFRFLQRLLLVHGRYANYRTSWLSQFCFYKSTLLSLIQVLYMFSNGYSGASFFNSFNLMCYNAIFTILPVIFFLQDKDIEESSVFLHPYVYQDSQHSLFCNKRTLFWWYMRGIYQAIVVTIIWVFVFTEHHANNVDGNSASLDEAQQVVYSSVILIVLFTVTLDTMHFTALNLIFIWGSWVLYVLLTVIASSISSIGMVKEMYLVMWRTTANPIHWCTVITMVSAAIAPPFFAQSIITMVTPTRTQVIRKNETVKRSIFKPVYLVSRKQNRDDKRLLSAEFNPSSKWDNSDAICLCCSC